MIKKLFTALALLSCVTAAVAEAPSFPNRAVVTMRGYWGMVPVGKAVQTWAMTGQNYRLENRMSGWGYTIRYVSDGFVENNTLRPTHYAEFRGKDSTPKYESYFDWVKKTVSFGKPNEQKVSPLQGLVQDLNALPYDLAWRDGKATSYTQLSTGRKLKPGPFVVMGEQEMEVGDQTVKAVHLVSRLPTETVEIWLAPSLQYIPLRIKYTGSEKIELMTTKVELNNKVVLGD